MARMAKNVVALTPGGKITIEQVLGWLVISGVPDRAVPLSKVLREFGKRDLDLGYLPDKRIPADVFKKACATVRTGRKVEDGREVETDQIYEDSQRVVYQITLKVRDRRTKEEGGSESIEFEKSMRVRFSKQTSLIDVEPLEKDAYQQLAYLESAIRDAFDANAKMLPGGLVRRAVRWMIRDLGGTNVFKRSGVHFVPKGIEKKEAEPRDRLEQMAEVLEVLYGEDATMYLVPLANSDGEREMIQRHFEVNIEETIQEEIRKIAGVLQRDPKYVRKDLMRNTVKGRAELGKLHQRYKELVKDSLEGTSYHLGLLDEQIEALAVKANELGTEVEGS